jgi:hypothetical protein
LLKLRILIIAQILLHKAREQLGLDEAEHTPLYGNAVVRQCRTMRVRPNEQGNRRAAPMMTEDQSMCRRVRFTVWLGPIRRAFAVRHTEGEMNDQSEARACNRHRRHTADGATNSHGRGLAKERRVARNWAHETPARYPL